MTTLLFLAHGDRPYRWRRLTDDGGIAEGDGLPPFHDDAIVAVAPAEAVTLHWADLAARSPAQAVAAARLLVAEASATPIGELHVAVGADHGDADRAIAVVGSGVMAAWLTDLAGTGIDPAAIVPAALLLPRPDEGYVRAHVAGAALVRGRSSGFADEARLTELVVGDAPVETLSREVVDDGIAAAIVQPPLDLRQGPFARRRRRIGIDVALVRRLALLGAAILLVTLAIDLVKIGKYRLDTSALADRAEALGRTGLARGETVTDVDRQLAERLSGVRGPGLGFSTTVAAVYAAVRATPGTELTSLDFQSNGHLRIGVGAARESLPTDLKRALEATGFTVTAGTFQSTNGRVTGEMTVSRP